MHPRALIITALVVPLMAGSALGADGRWTRASKLERAGASYSTISVDTSRRGAAVVGWITEANCCDGEGALSARYRRSLRRGFSAPVRLTRGGARLPTTAITHRGDPLVAWNEGGAIRVAAGQPSGAWIIWTVANKVSNVVSMSAGYNVDGTATVAWVRQTAVGSPLVQSATAQLDSSSATWRVEDGVTVPNGPVTLAVSESGTAIAAWPTPVGAVNYALRPAGRSWGDVATLAPAGNAVPATAVRLAIAPLGQVVAAWFDQEATVIKASMMINPLNPEWDAPTTLTTSAAGLFGNLAVSIDNGAAVAWSGPCQRGRQLVTAAHRAGSTGTWVPVRRPPPFNCADSRSVVTSLGVLRGPRLVLLAPTEAGSTGGRTLGAQGTVGGRWQRGALPAARSVAALDASGRVGLFVWSDPDRRTALRWRQYIAPRTPPPRLRR